MFIPKSIQFAVRFMTFAQRFNIPPADLARMIVHAERSFRAFERNQGEAEIRHGEEVERLAGLYGCRIQWPGLWPEVVKGNQSEPLPAREK